MFEFKSIICVKTAQRTSANLIRALYNLSRKHDSHKRKSLLNAGLIEMIKWFSLAARKIVQSKMKLHKQTQKFMDRHQDDVRKLASAIVDPEVKRSIILKPGGGGFFWWCDHSKIVSEYDQEIPQSQTADNPWHREEEPLNHHETPGRQIK